MEALSAITTALALGAAAGLEGVAAAAVKDAYAATKKWLSANFPDVLPGVEVLERSPGSKVKQESLKEDLENAGAADSAELLTHAEMLLALIEVKAPHLGEAIGVSLEDIKAASLSISDIRSGGAGVSVRNARIDGAIDIKGVRAGSGGSKDPNG
jgi:hypothetical protein